MTSDHFLQHDSQDATLDIYPNDNLAPLALLSQTAIDLLEVVGGLEFGG